MRVECMIEECEIENDEGHEVPSVRACCRRCGHETEAYGTGEASIRRALVMLREECPRDESNFYIEVGGGEGPMPDPVVRPWWEAKR
jgi:hypothetical protein